MNKNTQNKIAMYKAVKSVINANQTIVSGIPAFVSVAATFIEKLNALEQRAYDKSLVTVGISAEKDSKRLELAIKTYAISSGIAAFAVINNDSALIDQMKIGKWELKAAGKNRLLQLVDRVIAKASTFENELADFGVNAAAISELQTLRDEVSTLLDAPRNAIVQRKLYTQQVRELREELDRILKMQLDKLMIVVKEAHPEFFASYMNARVIVDLKNRRGSKNPERDDGAPGDRSGTGSDPEMI